jgi:uncharacterized membrane protein
MALGYVFGEVMALDALQRRRWLVLAGGALVFGFVVLRATNLYGDPMPWTVQKDALFTVFSFVNCEKYPPSLCYLLMTLGPALLALAALEGRDGPLVRPLVVFGRVPLFYYLLHLPLIALTALGLALARFGPQAFEFLSNPASAPENIGFGLPVVYAVWVGIVLVLYLPCLRFMELRRRRKDEWPWLSYF